MKHLLIASAVLASATFAQAATITCQSDELNPGHSISQTVKIEITGATAVSTLTNTDSAQTDPAKRVEIQKQNCDVVATSNDPMGDWMITTFNQYNAGKTIVGQQYVTAKVAGPSGNVTGLEGILLNITSKDGKSIMFTNGFASFACTQK